MENNSKTDIKLPVLLQTGQVFLASMNIRPLAKECLAKASQFFEVVVFTASWQDYADAVLRFLDPYGQFISHRLYRQHCTQLRGNYFKDLRILGGRDLKDVAIVDNLVHSFGFQIDNGIPIVSWYDDKNDRELGHLMRYFEELEKAEDVRVLNRGKFNLRNFCEEYEKKHAISRPIRMQSPNGRKRFNTRR